MTRTTMLMAVLAAGALALGPNVALAASWTSTASGKGATTVPQAATGIQLHGITGKVMAVDPTAKTVMVKGAVVEGPKNESVTANITDKTKIRQGIFDRGIADVKVGDRVWMVYQGTAHNWIADDVHIENPTVTAMPVEGPDGGRA